MNPRKRRRRERQQVERHHRHPKSHPESYSGRNIHESRNITYLPKHRHRAYHLLFGNALPDEVARILSEQYISPDWVLVAIKRDKPTD